MFEPPHTLIDVITQLDVELGLDGIDPSTLNSEREQPILEFAAYREAKAQAQASPKAFLSLRRWVSLITFMLLLVGLDVIAWFFNKQLAQVVSIFCLSIGVLTFYFAVLSEFRQRRQRNPYNCMATMHWEGQLRGAVDYYSEKIPHAAHKRCPYYNPSTNRPEDEPGSLV